MKISVAACFTALLIVEINYAQTQKIWKGIIINNIFSYSSSLKEADGKAV